MDSIFPLKWWQAKFVLGKERMWDDQAIRFSYESVIWEYTSSYSDTKISSTYRIASYFCSIDRFAIFRSPTLFFYESIEGLPKSCLRLHWSKWIKRKKKVFVLLCNWFLIKELCSFSPIRNARSQKLSIHLNWTRS